MPEFLPSIVVGSLLLIFAILSGLFQWQSWNSVKTSSTDEREISFLYRRYRRRIQISLLIGFVGIMIPLGDWLPLLRVQQTIFAIYWLAVLLIVAWVVVIAIADYFSTRLYYQSAHTRLAANRLRLEEEILAHRNRSNDHEASL